MKRLMILLAGMAMLSGNVFATEASCCGNKKNKHKRPVKPLVEQIPVIEGNSNWTKIPDVAQFGEGDWTHLIGKAENVSIYEAQRIADNNPDITYFFYMKSYKRAETNMYRRCINTKLARNESTKTTN